MGGLTTRSSYLMVKRCVMFPQCVIRIFQRPTHDDQTNPLPLEHIIREDPHVRGCLIFGQGKFQNGVLIEPKPEYVFDPRDEKKLEEFRNKLWYGEKRLFRP